MWPALPQICELYGVESWTGDVVDVNDAWQCLPKFICLQAYLELAAASPPQLIRQARSEDRSKSYEALPSPLRCRAFLRVL